MKNSITGIDVNREKPDLYLLPDGKTGTERAVENSAPAIRSFPLSHRHCESEA